MRQVSGFGVDVGVGMVWHGMDSLRFEKGRAIAKPGADTDGLTLLLDLAYTSMMLALAWYGLSPV